MTAVDRVLLAAFVLSALIVGAVWCAVRLAQRDALLAERDVPNARLLEPLPPPVGRHRPPRRVSEEWFADVLRAPAGRGPVVYRSAPSPLPGADDPDRTTLTVLTYLPGEVSHVR